MESPQEGCTEKEHWEWGQPWDNHHYMRSGKKENSCRRNERVGEWEEYVWERGGIWSQGSLGRREFTRLISFNCTNMFD